eukprot:g4406.t1
MRVPLPGASTFVVSLLCATSSSRVLGGLLRSPQDEANGRAADLSSKELAGKLLRTLREAFPWDVVRAAQAAKRPRQNLREIVGASLEFQDPATLSVMKPPGPPGVDAVPPPAKNEGQTRIALTERGLGSQQPARVVRGLPTSWLHFQPLRPRADHAGRVGADVTGVELGADNNYRDGHPRRALLAGWLAGCARTVRREGFGRNCFTLLAFVFIGTVVAKLFDTGKKNCPSAWLAHG